MIYVKWTQRAREREQREEKRFIFRGQIENFIAFDAAAPGRTKAHRIEAR